MWLFCCKAQTIPTPPPESKMCPPGRILDGFIAEIDQFIEYYHWAKFGASNPTGIVIFLQTSNVTHPLPLDLKCDPPERILDGPIA